MTAPPPPVDRPGEHEAIVAACQAYDEAEIDGGYDAHAVAAAVAAAYPIIAAALADAIEKLHPVKHDARWLHYDNESGPEFREGDWCPLCRCPWPCPTVAAARGVSE